MKKIEFRAYVDGKQVCSTGPYDFDHCMADECTDIGMSLSMSVVSMYSEEAEEMDRNDFL